MCFLSALILLGIVHALSASIIGLASNATDPQLALVSRKCYGTGSGGEEETVCPSGIARCITMRGTQPIVRGTRYVTYKSCWPEEAVWKCDSATVLAAMKSAGKLYGESQMVLWSDPKCCTEDLCNNGMGPADVWTAVAIVVIALAIIVKIVECCSKEAPAVS